MREQALSLHVADDEVGALLRLPDRTGEYPTVIHCPGWMSTKDAAHYVRYHETLAANGIATLAFDYRAYRRQVPGPVIDPRDMVADAMAAVRSAREFDEVRDDRVVMFGSGGVGAAIALLTGSQLPKVAGVVMLSPIATGRSWLRWMHGEDGYEALLENVERDREAQRRGEPPVEVAPVGGISVPPEERARLAFKRDIAGDLVERVALASVPNLLALDLPPVAAALAPRPLLVIACRDDVAVPYADAQRIAESADPATTRLITLEGTNSYRMHATNQDEIAEHLVGFAIEMG